MKINLSLARLFAVARAIGMAGLILRQAGWSVAPAFTLELRDQPGHEGHFVSTRQLAHARLQGCAHEV